MKNLSAETQVSTRSAPSSAISFGYECLSTTPPGYGEFPIDFVEAHGVWLKDASGRAWFDATGGSGAVNLGHGDKRVLEAVHRQVDMLIHTGWNIATDIRRQAVTRLALASGFSDPAVLSCLSGAEAVEAACKVARAFTGRRDILAFEYGFHGKSGGALEVTWRESLRKFAGRERTSEPLQVSMGGLDAVADTLEKRARANALPAAIIIEPVQVSEGIMDFGDAWLNNLILMCRRYDVLCIFDEIYTGFGRTGALFKCHRAGMMPDLLIVGKALGNGFPISAVLGGRDLLNTLPEGHHSSTFAGHPVSAAAANEVVRIMCEERPWLSVEPLGRRLVAGLHEIAKANPAIRAIRRDGLLVAFEFWSVNGDGNAIPDAPTATQFARAAFQTDVIVRTGGYNGAVVKLTPPITVSEPELDFLINALSAASCLILGAS
ncbi:4-aminobutyrate aminotransferase family protein [Rhizobium leguminosarum bv. viciae WSM1455]|nr:4-aminobutyrate aminotransferase family protein [Rhizobium leguminosarum bv. viciae WSM1455]